MQGRRGYSRTDADVAADVHVRPRISVPVVTRRRIRCRANPERVLTFSRRECAEVIRQTSGEMKPNLRVKIYVHLAIPGIGRRTEFRDVRALVLSVGLCVIKDDAIS